MSNQNNIYTYSEYTATAIATYHKDQVAMVELAKGYLDRFFWKRIPEKAHTANQQYVSIPFESVSSYIEDCEKTTKTISQNISINDRSTQVMLFIRGILEGVEFIYRDEAAGISVRNPLWPSEEEMKVAADKGIDILTGRFYTTVLGDKEGGRNGELIVHFELKLPTCFYDPIREAKKAAEAASKKNEV